MSGVVFKSAINNKLKDFAYVKCLQEEQKDCIKNMVNGKDVFAILPTSFGKSNLSTLSTSNICNECKRRCRLHDHGDGLSSSSGHNERPS